MSDEEIIASISTPFKGIYVEGVIEVPDDGTPNSGFCMVDNENPEFFSVYIQDAEGLSWVVEDFSSREAAEQYRARLAARFSL